MDDGELVTLPDGSKIPERRARPKRKVLERIAAEPLASIAIGLTLAVLAWGTITSNTRNANEAKNASVNARAARDTAEAARVLSDTIKTAQDQLANIGAQSRQANFSSHEAIQDTVICLVETLVFHDPKAPPVRPAELDRCKKPLTPPPVDDKHPQATTTTTVTTR